MDLANVVEFRKSNKRMVSIDTAKEILNDMDKEEEYYHIHCIKCNHRFIDYEVEAQGYTIKYSCSECGFVREVMDDDGYERLVEQFQEEFDKAPNKIKYLYNVIDAIYRKD